MCAAHGTGQPSPEVSSSSMVFSLQLERFCPKMTTIARTWNLRLIELVLYLTIYMDPVLSLQQKPGNPEYCAVKKNKLFN